MSDPQAPNPGSGSQGDPPPGDSIVQQTSAATNPAMTTSVQVTAGPSTQAPLSAQSGPAGPSDQASAGSPAPRSRMLLACDRCRSRKSKCDRNLPSCTGCLQAGVPCMSGQRDRFLSSDGKHVPRGYIEDLESQVRNLEATYNQLLLQPVTAPIPSGTPHGSGPPVHFSGPSHAAMGHTGAHALGVSSAEHPPSQGLAAANPSSAAGFSLPSILSTEYTVSQAVKISNSDPMRGDIPNQLFGGLSATFDSLHPLKLLRGMDRNIVTGAMNVFFTFVHEHYPLLLREDIRQKYELMMDNSYTAGKMTPTEELVVYLVVIVGITVSSDLRDATTFAQTLYIAALKVPGTFTEDDSLASVQVLTLMTIYSLYDPCAGSSWHLLELAVGKCLSMGLHLISSALGNGIETSTRIWAFWTLYSLDRMSGACMGRPFTIANDDLITVPVPGIRDIGASDGTGFLSGSLVTYYQILYRARRDPDHQFISWVEELDKWRRSSKTTLQLDVSFNSANPARDEWISSMKMYIDLIYNQGILLVPQYNIESPTWNHEFLSLFGSDTMYEASTQVGISLAVHRFPLAWTAGYKAFATGMTYLLCLTQRDRSQVDIPETYHVLIACMNVLEVISVKFSGLLGYAKFLNKATDMMFRLFNVESKRSPIADDPNFLHGYYTEAVPRSPNSGVPQPPEIEELRSRKFRCLARLYISAMEEISRKIFEDRHAEKATTTASSG